MNKPTPVKIINDSPFLLDDFKTISFYRAILKLTKGVLKSNVDVYSNEDLVAIYGEIALAVILYLENSGAGKAVAVKSIGGGVRFDMSRLKTMAPLVKLKIRDLKIIRFLNYFSIGISIGALIASVFAVFR